MVKNLKILALFSFIFLPLSSLYSNQLQDSIEVNSNTKVYVDKIVFAGNKTTKDVVILREMKTREGSLLNVNTLKDDIQRIYNLGLFTKVDVTPVPVASDSLNLIITVQESFYILPIPQGGIKEGSLKKVWGGLKIKWRNFRGMNETLGLSFGIGYEPFINASYSNPWLGSDKYFLSAGVGYAQKYVQDIYNLPPGTVVDIDTLPKYSTENINFNLSFGRFLTRNLSVSIGGGYNRTSVQDYQPGRSLSPTGIDDYPTATLSSHLDSRDLYSYPTNGAYGNLSLTQFGFSNRYINFNRASLDARKYIPIIPFDGYTIVFASRILGAVSWGGNIPPYLKEKFGYGNEIRGWSGKVFEGDNLLGLYAEFRFPIIKPNYIDGKNLPIIKNISFLSGLSYKYGLYFTTFYDVGGVWDKNDDFYKTQFRSGYGVGLNAILPFDFVGRMDLGFSKQDQNKLTLDLILDISASF
ncbi:MAG: BamA/TamA family outer membrane protein [Ignavibacteriae bacterium]|nr:BamA/TamA family outer membrane protein [Ignavibacteriota bacterium]MCB9243241.1 BamA/TamA family outer membrane protein [Ignavibacteriales bacterium]